MGYYNAKVTLDRKTGVPKVNKKDILVSKTPGQRKYSQIRWEIEAQEDDVFAIYIDGNVFDERRGPRNSYSVTIKKSGKGKIETKKLRSKAPVATYKYIIVRVSGPYKEDVKVLDPRISVQG